MTRAENRSSERPGGIKGLLFSRTTIVLLLLMLQFAFFFLSTFLLRQHAAIIYTGITVLSAVVVIVIINQKGNPGFKMTWILLVLVFPVFGTLFFVYTRLELGYRITRRELFRTHFEVSPYMQQNEEVMEALYKASPADAGLAYYLSRHAGYPVYRNTQPQYFTSGEAMFEELKHQLWNAERFIFLEFFIIEPGVMLDTVLEILQEKAREGVDVRFLFDGMNSITHVPDDFPAELKKKGISGKFFSPVRPVITTVQNNRDHRKICVIDGETAFTGGINLADEYINQKEKFGHWKDGGVMYRGDAMQSFTMMFLEMWNAGEKEPLVYDRYLTPSVRFLKEKGSFIIPYGVNPFDEEYVGENIYAHIVKHAKKYVHIMTPYLILDNEMIMLLTYAAKSGVDVKIILPGIPDKKYAFALAGTYYTELIQAGVQIYEYTPGFVHSKVVVSDDDCGTVGTVNWDYRSFFEHFECGSYLFRSQVIRDMELDFEATMEQCRRVTLVDVRKRPLVMRISGWVLRLVAPLM